MDQVVDFVRGLAQEFVIDLQEVAWFFLARFGWDATLRIVTNELHKLLDLKRSHGRYRSLPRLIGSTLYLQPQRKIFLKLTDSCFDSFAPTLNSTALSQSIKGAIGYYEEEEGEANDERWVHVEEEEPHMDSLTFGGESAISSQGDKVAALQEELAQLKAQIAAFVHAKIEEDELPPPPDYLLVSPTFTPPSSPTWTCPPPPPLPPKTFSQFSNFPPSPPPPSPALELKNPPPPSMMEVLKGLGAVKLRPVARSPGGNPVRQAPLLSDSDPASVIAEALKRRFAGIHGEDESENDFPGYNGGFGMGKENLDPCDPFDDNNFASVVNPSSSKKATSERRSKSPLQVKNTARKFSAPWRI